MGSKRQFIYRHLRMELVNRPIRYPQQTGIVNSALRFRLGAVQAETGEWGL